MDKRNIVYPHRDYYYIKKEWNTIKCYNIDDFENIMLSESNHDLKGHMLHDSNCIKCPCYMIYVQF